MSILASPNVLKHSKVAALAALIIAQIGVPANALSLPSLLADPEVSSSEADVTEQQGTSLVDIYGFVDVSIERVENEVPGTRAVYQNSNHSHVGLKGSAELEQDMRLIYQLEWGVDLDAESEYAYLMPVDETEDETTGDDSTFTQRNQMIGIESRFGAVSLGKQDTPLKVAQQKVDAFDDSSIDMEVLIGGELRADNAVLFRSPKLFEHLNLSYMLIPGEGEEPNDGAADSTSSSISFESDFVTVALGFDNELAANGVKGEPDESVRQDRKRLTISGKVQDVVVGLLAQKSEVLDEDVSTEGLISVQYTQDKNTIKLQGIEVKHDVEVLANIKETFNDRQVSLGVDRAVGPKTKVYGFIADRDLEHSKLYIKQGKIVAFGLRHSF